MSTILRLVLMLMLATGSINDLNACTNWSANYTRQQNAHQRWEACLRGCDTRLADCESGCWEPICYSFCWGQYYGCESNCDSDYEQSVCQCEAIYCGYHGQC